MLGKLGKSPFKWIRLEHQFKPHHVKTDSIIAPCPLIVYINQQRIDFTVHLDFCRLIFLFLSLDPLLAVWNTHLCAWRGALRRSPTSREVTNIQVTGDIPFGSVTVMSLRPVAAARSPKSNPLVSLGRHRASARAGHCLDNHPRPLYRRDAARSFSPCFFLNRYCILCLSCARAVLILCYRLGVAS